MNKSSIINSPTDFIIHLQDRNWISFQFPSIKFSLFPVGTTSTALSLNCSWFKALHKLFAFENAHRTLHSLTVSIDSVYLLEALHLRLIPNIHQNHSNKFVSTQTTPGTVEAIPMLERHHHQAFSAYLAYKNLVSPAYLSNEHKKFCIYYTNKKIHASLPDSIRFLIKKKGKGTCTFFMYSTKHRMNG